MERIRNAIFFDNNQGSMDNVKEFCSSIELVKIEESSVDAVPVPFADPDFASYLAALSPNSYVESMKVAFDSDAYDKRSGIQPTHLPIWEDWLRRTAGTERAAIFDWDRTLTVVEGFFFAPSSLEWRASVVAWLNKVRVSHLLYERPYRQKIARLLTLPDVTPHDIVLYLVGGEARRTMLRTMFQTCKREHVTIVILTNNTACTSVLFDELLRELFQDIEYVKICSNAQKGKSQFLVQNPRFQRMCEEDIYVGGSKKKKQTRRKRKRVRSRN